jgi:hypothetical protein
MNCPYCHNLEKYDLLPAERIRVTEEYHWKTRTVKLDAPKVILAHREQHPVACRTDFYIPCCEGSQEASEIERMRREDRIKLREKTINTNRLVGMYAMPCTSSSEKHPRPTVKQAMEAKMRIEGSAGTLSRNHDITG